VAEFDLRRETPSVLGIDVCKSVYLDPGITSEIRIRGHANREWAKLNADRPIASAIRRFVLVRSADDGACRRYEEIRYQHGFDRSDAVPIKSEAESLAVILRCEPSNLAP